MQVPAISLPHGRIAFMEAGNPDAPLALCLHGFPDTPHCFDGLLPRLADAGWHAIAPWLPGYAPSDPLAEGGSGIAAVGDAMADLADRFRHGERIVAIGHDWGAAVTYALAASYPAMVERAVTMAVPHPSVFGAALLTDYAQQKRSWYMYLFQIAGIAEAVVGMNDMAFLDQLAADWSPGWVVPDAYRRHVRAALAAPANLSAALGYYRSMFDPATGLGPATPIEAPTLLLMGADDGCIGADLASRPAPIFTGEYRAEVLDGCGHFLLQERPDEVTDRILAWLA